MMTVETLRLILLLVRARLVKPSQVAKATGRGRVTIYRWLIWRRKPLSPEAVDLLLDVADEPRESLSRPVRVTEGEIEDAVRWYQLEFTEDEIRAAAGDVPGVVGVLNAREEKKG